VTHNYEAMFPGSDFASIFFINFGQDDAPSTVSDGNGGDRYVYAMANDGYAYNGSYEILGRVPRTDLATLDAAKWQYYENNGYSDGSGNDSRNWTSSPRWATRVLSATHRLSQASIQYVPTLQRYVMTSFYYPNFDQCWPSITSRQRRHCSGHDEAGTTRLSFFQAPAPWGPWTQFYSASTGRNGWYDPTLVPKFMSTDGLQQTIFTSGDFVRPGSDLYSLHALPFTLANRS
jgi:hypothetical protein